MNRRLLLVPAAVTLSLGVAGTALANTYTADATCSGMSFSMPRTEDGTTVTTRLDGRTVRTDTVTTFGAPVVFTLVSPDQAVQHVWQVTIDATWSADQTWTETVPACVAVTTPPAPSSSTTSPSTLPPASVVPTTTSGTAPVTVPLVVTPRPTTTTTAAVAGWLPETGGDAAGTLAIGALIVAAGCATVVAARRRAS